MAADGRIMFVALDWIERHCIVPDGFRKGEQFRLYRYQLDYLAAFYTVHNDAKWVPENPILAPAFVYRRGLLVGPQKVGKNPLIATQVCLEGVGPALFAGWAAKDEGYSCADHGCGCGWEYAYDEGEPRGMSWPTPLIQITAFSEDSTENTYDALRPMIDDGPLHDLIPKTGEDFIRLPGKGRIDTVTSSNQSRLGQRVTFVPQDELGLWHKTNGMEKLADTQYRNLAGMKGRASLTSNAWDPSQHSVAQREYESAAQDVYRQFTRPPANLSYANKRERHKIHLVVYPEDTRSDAGHVSLAAIEAEAADMAERDLPQASRFFGNLLVTGAGKAFDLDRWLSLAVKRRKTVPDGALITLGFDGSRRSDHTALVASEVASGYQWPLGIWKADEHHGEIPSDLVDAAVETAFETWDVWRLYADPPYWEDTVASWAGTYGKERVITWWTNRPKAMAYALRGWSEAHLGNTVSHCAVTEPLCALFSQHVGNAYKHETGYRDDIGGNLWIIEKDRPHSPNKIDAAVAATLSWEARKDAITAGALNVDDGESAYDEGYVSPYKVTAA